MASWLVFTIFAVEDVFASTGKWGGALLGRNCICRVYLHRNVFGCPWKDHLQLHNFLIPWTCLCMGIFLVKTIKRVMFSEVRRHESSQQHFLLLLIAFAQFPLSIWLGNVGVHWLF